MGINERPERIALFLDLENFAGHCLTLGLPIDLSTTITRLTELGKVTIRRSYGDIQKLPIPTYQKNAIRKMLQYNLIQHEDIPYQNQYKNAADIRLVIDALSTAYSNEDINFVAIVAEDRDYIPLFIKLREMGKEIIGIGIAKDSTPSLSIKSCDYFFYHEILSSQNIPESTAISNELKEISSAEIANRPKSVEVIPDTEIAHPTPETQSEDALKLLTESLKVLDQTGNNWHVGGEAIQMMRRLKSDFDYSAYGYKNFKELCLQAAEKGLIDIDHEGVTFNLHLCENPNIEKPLSNSEQADDKNSTKFRKWFEKVLRIPLPSCEHRENIYLHLSIVMKDIDNEKGVELTALTDKVLNEINDLTYTQVVCYKLLFSLYRANCFMCSQGVSKSNPRIRSLKFPDEDYTFLDNKFIENALRLFQREHWTDIDPEAWSEVFFGTPAQSTRIEEISRTL